VDSAGQITGPESNGGQLPTMMPWPVD
jgi:hypothetical protein